MQISLYLSLCLLGLAAAAPTSAEVAAFESPFELALGNVGRALDSINGVFTQAPRFPSASVADAMGQSALAQTQALVNELRAGALAVKRGPHILASESVRFRTWSERITSLYRSTMAGWIDMKVVVKRAGATNNLLTTLEELSINTASFNDGINSKMVKPAKDFGKKYKLEQVAFVEAAIAAYKRR